MEDWGAFYDRALRDKVVADGNKFRVDLSDALEHPQHYRSHGWKLFFKDHVAQEVRQKFIKNVEQIVVVMKAQDHPPDELTPDRHRLSAALLVAVLQVAPFVSEPPRGNSSPLALRLPNETMALRLAEGFLVAQIMNTVTRKGLMGLTVYQHLAKYGNLAEPNLNANNGKPVAYLAGTYKRHLICALHHALGEGTLNVFFLAQILFWLEWNTLEKFSQGVTVPGS